MNQNQNCACNDNARFRNQDPESRFIGGIGIPGFGISVGVGRPGYNYGRPRRRYWYNRPYWNRPYWNRPYRPYRPYYGPRRPYWHDRPRPWDNDWD